MIGFLIGTVCLIGLFKVLRHGRGWGAPWSRWDGGCGHQRGPWQGRFGGRGRRSWGGSGAMLRALSERLDASPAQEKVIREAADELRASASGLRDELRGSRTDVARAVRSPSFDETRIGELFARHDTAIESMRKAAVGAVAKVHAVLDERQREQLADLIESGPFASRWRDGDGDGHGHGHGHGHGGPYRAWL